MKMFKWKKKNENAENVQIAAKALLKVLREEQDRRIQLAAEKITTTTTKDRHYGDERSHTTVVATTTLPNIVKDQAAKDVLRYMKAIDGVLGIDGGK